jgi:hypothetical protein
MRTRSQRAAKTKLSSVKEGMADGQHRQWNLAKVDRMELDVPSNTYLVTLIWPDGSDSEIDRDKAYEYCSEQVCSITITLYFELQSHDGSLDGFLLCEEYHYSVG